MVHIFWFLARYCLLFASPDTTQKGMGVSFWERWTAPKNLTFVEDITYKVIHLFAYSVRGVMLGGLMIQDFIILRSSYVEQLDNKASLQVGKIIAWKLVLLGWLQLLNQWCNFIECLYLYLVPSGLMIQDFIILRSSYAEQLDNKASVSSTSMDMDNESSYFPSTLFDQFYIHLIWTTLFYEPFSVVSRKIIAWKLVLLGWLQLLNQWCSFIECLYLVEELKEALDMKRQRREELERSLAE